MEDELERVEKLLLGGLGVGGEVVREGEAGKRVCGRV